MAEELDIYNIEESKYVSEKNLFSKKSEATESMKKEKQKQMIEHSKRR